MNYTLIRNATAVLEVGGSRFLIDPMLDPARTRPAIEQTLNQQPNPLVELPEGWEELIGTPDALVVTHLHMDHFDETAGRVLDHDLPVFCQPEDIDRLREKGFRDVRAVEREEKLGDTTLIRISAQHGSGEVGRLMAPVSGFVFSAPDDPLVYVTADTIWYDEVAEAIATYLPEIIVVNGGGARFIDGGPIVMTAEDIAHVHKAAPEALIIVVHLEAINHCPDSRAHYRERLPALGVPADQFVIPSDGETVEWSNE